MRFARVMPDVEQPALLRQLGGRARLLRRQLLLLQPRDEDRLELEALGAMQRQQIDAVRGVAAGGEPTAKILDERRRVTVEDRRELHQPARDPAGARPRARRACRARARASRRRAQPRARPRRQAPRSARAAASAGAPHRARGATTPGTGCRLRAAALRSRSDERSSGRGSPSPRSGHVSARSSATIAAPSSSGVAIRAHDRLGVRPGGPSAASSRRRRGWARACSRARAPAASSGSSPRAARRPRCGKRFGIASR